MPFEPLRFVHAADLRLDCPLLETGPLPAELYGIIEEATLTAFERVVAACLEQRADFLLLTGSSFDDADRSLRARAALLGGFERLHAGGVQVFVVPGRLDPLEAWRSIPDLPRNVSLVEPDGSDPLAVLRNGKVVASIGPGGERVPANGPAETPAPRKRPFIVGLLPKAGRDSVPFAESGCDYVALGGERTRRTVPLNRGTAHHPGGTQGLHPDDCGPHGCTLVEVDASGATRCTFLPTAPVRWERLCLDLNDDAGQNDLAARAAAVLDECRAEDSEQLWLVNWTIRAAGSLAELVEDDATRSELEQALVAGTSQKDRPRSVHRLHPPHAGETAGATPDCPLAAQFLEALDRQQPIFREILDGLIDEADGPATDWAARLESLMAELDHEAVLADARRLGANWFETAAGVE